VSDQRRLRLRRGKRLTGTIFAGKIALFFVVSIEGFGTDNADVFAICAGH
jgi:hypothetical protein